MYCTEILLIILLLLIVLIIILAFSCRSDYRNMDKESEKFLSISVNEI